MKRLFEFFALILLGFFLVFLLTWPLIARINTYYDDTSEYAFVGWILWYNQHSIATGRILDSQAYFFSNQFYPFPFSLAYSEHLFIPSLIFAPIYWVTQDLAFSVNFFNILAFVLTFISSYYCLKFFLKKHLPSLIGAFVFTFNTITLAQFFGHHLQFLNKYFIPPLFLFSYLYIKDPGWKRAFYFYSFFTLNALSNIHFQIFSLILIPIFWSPFVLVRLFKKDIYFFISFLKTSLIFIIFLPFLYYFNYPYFQFSSLEGVIRSLSENAGYSARGIDWLTPNWSNWLYGRFAQIDPGGFNFTEHTLFLNIIPLVLFLTGLLFTRFNKVLTAFILVLVFSAIFTFGTHTVLYEKLYGLIIFLQGIRVPIRFQFFFYLPFALFAGLGADKILNFSGKWRLLVFGFIFLFLILENINTPNFTKPSQMIPYLKSEAIKQSPLLDILKGKNTIHLPVFTANIGNNIRYLNWSSVTKENVFNGYSGYFPDDWINLVQQANKLDEQSLENFFVLGIDYLIIHTNLLSQEEIKNYQNNQDFLNQAIVFQDKEIIVISFKKLNLKVTLCALKDIKIDIKTKIYSEIVLNNTKDCYLVNKYMDRYLKIDFLMKNKVQSINVKLPVLIEPYSSKVI